MSEMGLAGKAPQEENEKEKMHKTKHRRANATKIRVKLPPIESYQREVVFRAEGPGRVVVRLERLMGSDRVRLTDQKFMTTLLERLEADENKAWSLRNANRKKAESNRSRQLAIDGLMEPAADMQDLYQHPVFRVNRVLKRLAQFDQTMTAGQDIHLPPITQIDPFADDDTGAFFKSYAGHTPVENSEELPELSKSVAELYAELQSGTNSEYLKTSAMKKREEEEEKKFQGRDLNEDEDEQGEGEEEEEMSQPDREEWTGEGDPPPPSDAKVKLAPDATLTEIQQKYGIQPDEDLEADWEPFRSHLVDLIFSDDTGDITELYEMAEQVLGVYERENLTADDFVNKLPKLLSN